MDEPMISIMVPVFEPNAMLIETLEAVIAQRKELGLERMQIAVVDDGSREIEVRTLLRRFIDTAQIEFYANATNLGLAGNWNRCVKLARGELVHLLHQDDIVRSGFYRRLLAGFENRPNVGMAFCRHAFIDGDGKITDVSHRERVSPGILRDWLPKIARETRIQTPAAIVRRSVYETLGGFRVDLEYALDWEMWTRIAVHYDVWYEPAVLAHYRRHSSSETARLQASGATETDVLRAIEMIGATLPEDRRRELVRDAYLAFARRRIKRARKLIAKEQYAAAQTALRYGEKALLHTTPSLRPLLYEWRIKRLMRQASLAAHASFS